MTPEQRAKAREIKRRLRALELSVRDQERRAMAQDRRGEVCEGGVVVRVNEAVGTLEVGR
jgi:hypothetical protein